MKDENPRCNSCLYPSCSSSVGSESMVVSLRNAVCSWSITVDSLGSGINMFSVV